MEENSKPIFMYKDVPVRKTNDRCLLLTVVKTNGLIGGLMEQTNLCIKN